MTKTTVWFFLLGCSFALVCAPGYAMGPFNPGPFDTPVEAPVDNEDSDK